MDRHEPPEPPCSAGRRGAHNGWKYLASVKFGGRKRQDSNCARPSDRSNGTRGVGADQAGIGGSLSNQASPFFTDDSGKTIKQKNHNLWSRHQVGPGVVSNVASFVSDIVADAGLD